MSVYSLIIRAPYKCACVNVFEGMHMGTRELLLELIVAYLNSYEPTEVLEKLSFIFLLNMLTC